MTTDDETSKATSCATTSEAQKNSDGESAVKIESGTAELLSAGHSQADEGATAAVDNKDESVPEEPAASATDTTDDGETVDFKLIFNKEKFDITFPLGKTVLDLKHHVEKLTGVPATMSKLVYKGIAKDERTLKEWGVIKGAKGNRPRLRCRPQLQFALSSDDGRIDSKRRDGGDGSQSDGVDVDGARG